jgi:hypothetical protein
MTCQKTSGVKTLLFVPDRIDPEISDLVMGYAEWGIVPQVIQIAGWPWATVSLEYSPDIAKFLSLWNASRKKSGEKWIIVPSGDRQIIPHPIFWETAVSLLAQGQEFGRFLKALPPDSLTKAGFERENKRMNSSASFPAAAKAAISRLLEPLCPQ